VSFIASLERVLYKLHDNECHLLHLVFTVSTIHYTVFVLPIDSRTVYIYTRIDDTIMNTTELATKTKRNTIKAIQSTK